jgi:hypothetical protein
MELKFDENRTVAYADWIRMDPDGNDKEIKAFQMENMERMLRYFQRRAQLETTQDIGKRIWKNARNKDTPFQFYQKRADQSYYVHPDILRVVFKILVDNRTTMRVFREALWRVLNNKVCPASLFVLLYELRTNNMVDYLTNRAKNERRKKFQLTNSLPNQPFLPWPFYVPNAAVSIESALNFLPDVEGFAEAMGTLFPAFMSDRADKWKAIRNGKVFYDALASVEWNDDDDTDDDIDEPRIFNFDEERGLPASSLSSESESD